jgi:DNA recombination protein RmuC
MEAVMVVLLVALMGLLIIGLVLLVTRRGPVPAGESSALDQQLAVLKSEIAQAVSSSQQTVLGQVNATDAKLNQRLDAVQSSVGQRLEAVQASMGQRFDTVQSDLTRSLSTNTQAMGRIGLQLGELMQSTRQMLEIGRDISSLQDILRPPKLRGGFGELLLERLLAEILPEKNYSTQHRFRNGVQVDAAIHIGGGVVPVDSKFPLEAFNRMVKADSDEERAVLRRDFVRAVRGHIDAVAKYILPDEGSFPFAMMYIPAENVYYEVIVKDDLGDSQTNLCAYAMERHVVPVSPNSFYAYLQAILLGLKGMQVEENAIKIVRHLEQLSGDFNRVRESFMKIGGHLKNAADRYSDADRAFSKFGDRLALTLDEPFQAALPDPLAAPAPIGEPALTNGHDES